MRTPKALVTLSHLSQAAWAQAAIEREEQAAAEAIVLIQKGHDARVANIRALLTPEAKELLAAAVASAAEAE